MEIVIKANNEVDSKVFFKRCDLLEPEELLPWWPLEQMPD